MRLRLQIVLLAVLLGGISQITFASNCASGGTTVFFENGMLTTQEHAVTTLNTLKISIEQALDQRAPNRDSSCIRYRLALNSRFVNQQGTVRTTGNFVGQLVSAALQLGLTNVWGRLFENSETVPSLPDETGTPTPNWNDPSLGQKYLNLNSFVSAFQPDVDNHVSLYQQELSSGNNVVIMAHSQGNLYLNQAYARLQPPPDRFTTVALATPDNNVVGDTLPPACGSGPTSSCYLTLRNDVVLAVLPFSLPGNATNTNTPDRCQSSVNSWTRCHDVDRSYIPGNVTRPGIVDAVVNRILSPLTVVKDGTGSGSVVSSPAGIDCGDTCAAQFYTGSTVTLTATAAFGSKFRGWSGDCAGSGPSISIILIAKKDCNATFDLASLLTVTKSGNGSGMVVSIPLGINCGPACIGPQMAPFLPSPPVQLTATFAPGSIFTTWSGDCAASGSSTMAQVTLTANKTCDAKFDEIAVSMTLGALNLFHIYVVRLCDPTREKPGNALPEVPGACLFHSGFTPFTTVAAPADITVTLHRDVISQCSGLLFSNDYSVTISQGQTFGGSLVVPGRDPACSTLPITTRWTILQAVEFPNTILDLSIVPSSQLNVKLVH